MIDPFLKLQIRVVFNILVRRQNASVDLPVTWALGTNTNDRYLRLREWRHNADLETSRPSSEMRS